MAPSADPPSLSNGYGIEVTSRSSPFTIENIPFGIVSTGDNPKKRCATAFEEWAVDLEVLETSGLFADIPHLVPGIFSNVRSECETSKAALLTFGTGNTQRLCSGTEIQSGAGSRKINSVFV